MNNDGFSKQQIAEMKLTMLEVMEHYGPMILEHHQYNCPAVKCYRNLKAGVAAISVLLIISGASGSHALKALLEMM
jgi:hypothetical protein